MSDLVIAIEGGIVTAVTSYDQSLLGKSVSVIDYDEEADELSTILSAGNMTKAF